MPTIADIAKVAGVSDMTVSRVLNGKADYRRPTFAKRADNIRKLASEMGYRPNAFAQGVRSGRFGTFGLLLGTDPERSALPLPLLRGIYDGLHERGLNLTLALLPDEKLAGQGEVPRLLQEQMADGLLINYTDHMPAGMVETIRRDQVPAVWINVQLPDNCVYPDDRNAGRHAAEHLLAMGHRRIAFVDLSHRPSDPAIHYSAHDRYGGYAEAMREAGLTHRRCWTEERDDPARRAAFALSVLTDHDRPTAVITLGQTNTVPLLVAAARAGLELPRDLSMICFEQDLHAIVDPVLATMVIPQDRVGREAVDMLDRQVNKPGRPVDARAVPYTFNPGDSCRPRG